MSYIELSVRTARVVHGYDEDNQEVVEEINENVYAKKLIRLDRIQSITERYVLVSSGSGRMLYWEYEGGFESLRSRLDFAGQLI